MFYKQLSKIAVIGILCLIVAVLVQTRINPHRISATAVHDFYVIPIELPELRSQLSQFAATENLRLYEYGAKLSTQDGRPLFAISLNKKYSILINVIAVPMFN